MAEKTSLGAGSGKQGKIFVCKKRKRKKPVNVATMTFVYWFTSYSIVWLRTEILTQQTMELKTDSANVHQNMYTCFKKGQYLLK